MTKSHGNLHEVSFKSLNPMKIPCKSPHVSHVFHPKKHGKSQVFWPFFPGKGGIRPCDQAIPAWLPWLLAIAACTGHMCPESWRFFGRGTRGMFMVHITWFIGICWDLLGFNGIYWDLLGFNGIYWDLSGFNGIYWDLLGFNGSSLGFIGIYDGILMVVYLWHILEY